MAKLRFTVHPLFIVFGIYFAFCGKVFSFLAFTIVAVIHELGHAVVAGNLGYRLERIVLMPYGAIISGEQELFSYPDEIKIALAGPIVNLLTVVLFAAVWWLVPETYAYTDTAVFASLSIATVNLLPAYPLDGGRLLLAALSSRIPRKRALMIVKCSGIAFGVLLFGLFVYSIFVGVNFSLLFFSLFMIFGNVLVSPHIDYVRLYSGLDMRAVKKGRTVSKVAVACSSPVKTLYKFVGVDHLTELVIVGDDGKIKNTLPFDKVLILLRDGRPYSSVGEEVMRLDLMR